MGRLSQRLTDLWRRTRLTRPRIDRVARCEARHEVPTSIARHTLVVVGAVSSPKWAVFECPCGRGHQLMVSLVPSHPRHWSLTCAGERPSLFPSVDFKHAHGRCHFWLTDGRVRFVRGGARA
jgi:hypothetical protein